MDFWIIFLTGLTVGGLTCLAVQGGLLASVIAAREGEEVAAKKNTRNTIFPTLAFLSAKLISYTILGFSLGGFGEVISISQDLQMVMQLFAGLYMVAIALNLLEVHPIFRYAVIQPPKFLARKLKKQSKSKNLFAPFVLGAFTIFIPCGTTLAMEALAISSGSPFAGAAIMGMFVLGTSPLFFGVGWVTSVLGDNFRARFLKVAALAILYLGLSSINGVSIAYGFPINTLVIENAFQNKNASSEEKLYSDANSSQQVDIYVYSNGYSPKYFQVKKGVPVSVRLIGKDAYSCASAFRIPSLGISHNLQPNETYAFAFTPASAGRIIYTCSMGMYSGVIEVI